MARIALILPLLIAACSSSSRDRSTPLPTQRPVEEARLLFAEASRAFNEKRFDDASDLYEEVYETWPASTLAPEAEYWAAESLYRDDELKSSYEAFKTFLEMHQLYARIDRVEERLFQIGTREIREGKSGMLGLGIFSTSDQGVEVLQFLVGEFRNGQYADDALMEIGRYQRASRDHEGAIITFSQLLDAYPQSPWRYQGILLLAASQRQLNRGAPYDPGTLRRARMTYEQYIREVSRDPARASENEARLELAERRIGEIDETLGAHELLAARWYIHLDENDAAAFYLTRAASIYADTKAGQEAAEILRSMGREVPERGSEPSPEEQPAAPAEGS